MRHILKTWRASELPEKRRHTEFSAFHNWQPSAVGRHDTHSNNRATFGSGTVSARVVAARAARSARPSDRKAKSHASSFNPTGRVAESSPTRNSYRRCRVDGHRVFLGRLDDWRHRHQTCG